MEELLQLDDLVSLVKDKKANTEQEDSLVIQTRSIISSYLGNCSVHTNHYDDIISVALLHIWKNIPNYKKSRGGFSSWVYCVARVAWNFHFYDANRVSKEKNKDYIEGNLRLREYYKKVSKKPIQDIDIKHDVILAIQALFIKFKSKRKVLLLVFGGDPFDKRYQIDYNDNVTEISRKTEVRKSVISRFIKKEVLPFMKVILGDYGA